jgi:polysaccharide deacetylase family protein (PEP-CTERM system associated)
MTSALAAPPHTVPDALSVDVEDYYHVEAFADRITLENWPQFPQRVADNTRRVLEIFERHGARATFFVLGWVAEREPRLVREILDAGHEIACHSYGHSCVWRMQPEEFRADTRRARAAIEDAGGMRVVGYRAPTFSILPRSLWAIQILAEEGFRYDASVFPIRHDLYGMPDAPRFCFKWRCRDGLELFEIPPLTVRVLGRNLPAGGGGYLRILPMWYTRWALRRVQNSDGQPATVYFHPWEIDCKQPRLSGRWKSRLRHYLNLGQMEARICELLVDRQFTSFGEFLDAYVAQIPFLTYGLFSGKNGIAQARLLGA